MFSPPPIDQVRTHFPAFQFASLLGSGTFKAAYKVKNGDQWETLKLFHLPDFSYAPDPISAHKSFVGRFSREIELLGQCNCPHLVKLGSVSPKEVNIVGENFIAYSEEFLDGEQLRTIIARGSLPSEDDLFSLLRCLVLSVTHLWENHQCVHRDIKPENIIRRTEPIDGFTLFDLGITFAVGGTRFTEFGTSPGTPPYRAPEMLDVNYADNLDARTDLYSVGVTVFEYASGQHPLGPFPFHTSIDSLILSQPPRAIETLRTDLSDNLCQIINRLNRKRAPLRGSLKLIRTELGLP
jgi:eukaryotic-like serine/threonine-protein kinase